MNSSISFDRAAGFYDSTRELPEAIANQGIQAILEAAGPGARILDVGTGTGRISVPLFKRGADLVGCDLSTKMMAVLRQKLPRAQLAQADASHLPFPTGHFDAVITVHVMHLIGPWREALSEYRRVLKPGGIYINARTENANGQSLGERVMDYWQQRVASHGGNPERPGVQEHQELQAELRRMGAELKELPIVRFSGSHSVNEFMERVANRIDSHTWNIPKPVFGASLQDLRQWVVQEFGALDRQYEEEYQFILDVACMGAMPGAEIKHG